MDEMGDTERERKIETILRQLEKLDHSSIEANSRLQQFTGRLFGHIYDIESKNQKEPRPNEETDICEAISYRIMHITATITSISLETESLMRELPPNSEVQAKEGF